MNKRALAALAIAAAGVSYAGGTVGASATRPERTLTAYTGFGIGATDGTGGVAATDFVYRPGCITRREWNRIDEGMTDREVVLGLVKADALSVLDGETKNGQPLAILYWPHCRQVGESSAVFVQTARGRWVVVAKSWSNR
jgi:hypothetical protein